MQQNEIADDWARDWARDELCMCPDTYTKGSAAVRLLDVSQNEFVCIADDWTGDWARDELYIEEVGAPCKESAACTHAQCRRRQQRARKCS